jgi:quinolinate synthase
MSIILRRLISAISPHKNMSELFSVKTIAYPFPAKPVALNHLQQQQYVQEIKILLKKNNAV